MGQCIRLAKLHPRRPAARRRRTPRPGRDRRSAAGDRRVFSFMILDGETAGHGKAGDISRTTLRAIFEAVHGIDPNDTSAEADAKRTGATLAGFNGATFLATLEIERGGERPEGGRYR